MLIKKNPLIRIWYLILLTGFWGTNLYPQAPLTNLNEYYKFPFSLSIEGQSCFYLGDNRNNNELLGINLGARFPLSFWPSLQPLAELGWINCNHIDPVRPDTLDHSQYYLLLGLAYAERLHRNFEFGVEIAGGASLSVFPNLVNNGQPTGSFNLVAETGLSLGIGLNYNFMVTVHPNLKYFRSFSSYDAFDGLAFGFGITAHYRFGEDPDLPRAPLNSLILGAVDLPPVFANMQHYYAGHPVGKITVTNPQSYPVGDIEITFSQKTFLDSPSSCGTVAELKPGETRDIELYATFNNRIFDIEGTQPVNGEISVAYRALGRDDVQKKSVSFELNDKTIVVWDDCQKLAALITPSDSVLKNYTGYLQGKCGGALCGDFNPRLQMAMLLYNALKEYGIVYQPDPVLPFLAVKSGEHRTKDTVALARDTLKRGSGDCDDLTALFCSLLESIGIETGYIIVPGHILPVFNTGEEPRSFADLGPDRDLTICVRDELWIPVEATLLGQAGFREAWLKGIEAYRGNADTRGFYFTRSAQEVYQPVALTERDLGLQYGDMKKVTNGFKSDLEESILAVTAGYEKALQTRAEKTLQNRLGSLYGYLGRLDKAESAFREALRLDENYLFAKVNMGILLTMKKEYGKAIDWYAKCVRESRTAGGYPGQVLAVIYRNMAGCYRSLGNGEKAAEYGGLADREGGLVSKADADPPENLNAGARVARAFLVEGRNGEAINHD
jgi:tetratricopeptide (TPR) repeat protein